MNEKLTVHDLAPLPPVLIVEKGRVGRNFEALIYAETLDRNICFIDLDTGTHHMISEGKCYLVFEI